MFKLTCNNCGKEYENRVETKYCSPSCYWENMIKKKKEYMYKKIQAGVM